MYQQPVIPYSYATQQPEHAQKQKKSMRNLVLLIVIPIFLGLAGVLFYVYRMMHEVRESVLQSTREMQRSKADDQTLPYSYDTSGVSAVEQPPQPQDTTTSRALTFTEVMPEFPGGTTALNAFIRNNVTYPASAKDRGIQGTVYLRFTIEKNGEVTNRKVLRGVSPELDREALRMLNKMPRWKPGTMNGNPVRIDMTQPVRFVLQ